MKIFEEINLNQDLASKGVFHLNAMNTGLYAIGFRIFEDFCLNTM